MHMVASTSLPGSITVRSIRVLHALSLSAVGTSSIVGDNAGLSDFNDSAAHARCYLYF